MHEISGYVITASAPASLDLSVPMVIDVTSAADTVALPVAAPEPVIGPEPSPYEIVQGNRMLQQLSLLPVQSMTDYVASNPEVVANLLANPPAATDVTMWWGTMDFEHRNALRDASPQLVGNLDGIPYAIRDLANRVLLDETISSLETTIKSEPGRTIVENAKYSLRMLTSIESALGNDQSQPRRTLLSLDVTGQGRAAIVLGDLRTADYVSYLVPGMFFTIENQMGDWADAAARLYEEELSWLELFDEPDSTVATVAWIGYHTPNLTNVGGIQNAEEGRDSLAKTIEGLQAIRGGDEPYVTVVAHSYGSTAALMALTEYDFEIDALALVGSPGSPAKSVSQLHVRNGNVFVGEAPWDPIPNSSYFGSDPGSASYGAHPMGVGGGIDVITNEVLLASSGHNEYFSAGTESMRNFALISIGKSQFVTDGSSADATKTLALLK